MKDTVIKGTGTSRKLKAPATMPETFDEWRSQLLAGTATVDISLNPAGCDVVGTALTKETLKRRYEDRTGTEPVRPHGG